ncbi:MAG TPA: 1-(5-phosphoribosyl)-5-[(5-phosphoribosylamino)methylideneamino]imidazole-4-carboxamide isomerase [Acidimicrobiales bacterium]|jgi:phosphoribosylformimino-5-aminoimidazole carboxamide ribotide isomerase|nr:1-(5-phosphoribosyl)-5-[(5-phosphoribosylamino)methylideneamino]imidazole-4-carboxamide isomerase [Acidimicrobiales bacterium]|tara:strand:+ start:1358 stop:2095 length:738 start_codon:yes stop_codon:yes gene_type:complete
MTFDLYPAIDIRDGQCVRLVQGDYDREVRYRTDPVQVARSFQEAGAPWIHVVDLDAARSGDLSNLETVGAIARAVDVPIQSGGGIRSVEAAANLYQAGVERCVVGTAAVENPTLIGELTSMGHRVAVGLDVRGDQVAIRGWEIDSGQTIFDLLPRFEQGGAEVIVVTQISRDGTGSGPDVEGLTAVLNATSLDVIASGGVGSLAHIHQLAKLDVNGRRPVGVIVGKAIHDGVIEVSAAIEATAYS